jgi:hypothetical protein
MRPDRASALRVSTTVPALGGVRVQLFLVSFTVLFVELVLIRWIPAYMVFVGFFSNFILMASFLGIGIGILLGRWIQRRPFSPFAMLLLLTVALALTGQLNLRVASPDEIFFGLNWSTGSDASWLVLPLVAVLVVAIMATLAAPLGPLLRSMPPLRAYTIDIIGSVTGIVVFAAMSAGGTDPLLWFAIVAVARGLLALGRGVSAPSIVPAAAMTAVFVLLVAQGLHTGDRWSPYYRVTAYDRSSRYADFGETTGPRAPSYFFVGGIPHQGMAPVEESIEAPLYGQVYRWFPDRTFSRVLIIGAGSGTDVALALAKGSDAITAVDIDPVLLDLGRQYHPDQPYSDPRVTAVIQDGRAYLARTSDQYDLIVYALTDSLTLVTGTANVRLESFLFTEQSLALARDRLTDDGVFVMYNVYREPWLVDKLVRMTADVFGTQPLLRLDGPADAVIAAGPAVGEVRGEPPGDQVDALPEIAGPTPRPALDDWPFLYLRTETIPSYYLGGLALLIAIGALAFAASGRLAGARLGAFSPHFFVLGAAFLLLETRSIITFSLLFGTTWLVNALAFAAILVGVLAAIAVTARFPRLPKVPLYLFLFGSILIAWVLPPESLLIDPPEVRYAVASVVAFAPVFFANLVFTRSFSETVHPDIAFASNLLGAMMGGALEYLSLLLGFRALLPIAAGLYVLAWVFATRVQVLGDQEVLGEPTAAPATATS